MPILEMLLQSLGEILSSALVSVPLCQRQALPTVLDTVSAASGSSACCSPSPEVTHTSQTDMSICTALWLKCIIMALCRHSDGTIRAGAQALWRLPDGVPQPGQVCCQSGGIHTLKHAQPPPHFQPHSCRRHHVALWTALCGLPSTIRALYNLSGRASAQHDRTSP
jgi:hypothetical protein